MKEVILHSKTTLLNITLIIISFLSILIAFLFVYFSLEKVDVYVADRLIKPKEIIAESDLKKISLPKAFIMDNVIISKEEIIGKNPIMDYTVLRNAFFYKGSLEDKDESKDGVYLKKEEGYVSYDLFIDDIKVNPSSLIKGMSIDLYLTVENDQQIKSDLLFDHVKIGEIYDKDGKKILSSDTVSKAYILTLNLQEEYVGILNEALKIGEVSLIVPEDTYEDQITSFNAESEFKALFERSQS